MKWYEGCGGEELGCLGGGNMFLAQVKDPLSLIP